MKVEKCSVIGCSSEKRNAKISFFKVPKPNSVACDSAITKINCCETVMKVVCADHFSADDLVTKYNVTQDVADAVGNRVRCGVKKGAVSSVFYSEKIPEIPSTSESNCTEQPFSRELTEESMMEKTDTSLSFNDLLKKLKNVDMPEGWMSLSSKNEVAFYKPKLIDGKIIIEKQLVIDCKLDIHIHVKHEFTIDIESLGVKLENPLRFNCVSRAIKVLDEKKLCPGGPALINFPGVQVRTATLENNKSWRHLKCSIIIDSKRKRCHLCTKLFSHFRVYKQRLLAKKRGGVITPTQ